MKEIKEDITRFSVNDLEGDLEYAITFLQTLRTENHHRISLDVEYEYEYYSTYRYAYINVTGYRWETDEEVEKRKKAAAKAAATKRKNTIEKKKKQQEDDKKKLKELLKKYPEILNESE